MFDSDSVSPSFILSFKEDLVFREAADGHAYLASATLEISLPQLSPGLQAACHRLATDGATPEQLLEIASRLDGPLQLPTLIRYLQYLTEQGIVCRTLVGPDGPLAMLVPSSAPYQPATPEIANSNCCLLSRFAYLHREAEHFVLECPTGCAKIVLRDSRAMLMISALSNPCNIEKMARELLGTLPEESIRAFMSLLIECQAVSVVSPGRSTEDESLSLKQWEFHDLLFHTRSRLGRNDKPLGATFRFLGQLDPLPAVKTQPDTDGIDLYTPDIDGLKKSDPPFTYVLENRRSVREPGDRPITVHQLGEFLYRTAHVRSQAVHTTGIQGSYERTSRPYPSGGACYELEVYVVAHRCAGLTAGLYFYCPQNHQLHTITELTPEVEGLLEQAQYATEGQKTPQILIILAARFQRVAWKYESMAYAMILKHVGVVYQTMYLVATAMGLAACAIGSGDSDLFAGAAGTDYYVETSVGEFILGSRAVDI